MVVPMHGKSEEETAELLSQACDGNSKVDYEALAAFASKEFHPLTFNRTLYTYNKSTKLYESDRGLLEAWVQKVINKLAAEGFLRQAERSVRKDKAEIYSRVFHENVIGGDVSPFDKYNGVPVGNGVLVFDESLGEFVLEDYRAEMLFTRKIPTNYNKEVNTAAINEILKSWVDENDHSYLIQIAAQALIQSLPDMSPFKKAYLINGEASGGKSTYLSFLEMVFGSNNISGVPVHRLGDRFNAAQLEGKFINSGDDIPNIVLKSADDFKTLVGKRRHSIERKGKDGYFTDLTAVHVYTCNRPPELDSNVVRDDAFWSRWVIVKFPFYYDNAADWAEKNLTKDNAEGFLRLAVEMAERIMKNGGVIHKKQDLDYVVETWQHESSPLGEFLEEHTDQGVAFTIPKAELHEAVVQYANSLKSQHDRSRLPSTQTALTQKLLRLGYSMGQERVKGKTMEVYKGMQWKSNSPYAKKETKNSSIV